MVVASSSLGASSARTKRKARPRRPSWSSGSASQKPDGYGKLQMELEWLKKISAAVTLVNYASWSITTTPSSVSAGNARCWFCPDPRAITGRHRCGNRPCRSWPGSILPTWRPPAAVAAGWWSTRPERGSRSAAIGCETSCGAWVYGRSIRSHAPRPKETHQSDSLPLDLKLVTAVDQAWATDITYIPLQKGFLCLVAGRPDRERSYW
jgi:hypothetical protein